MSGGFRVPGVQDVHSDFHVFGLFQFLLSLLSLESRLCPTLCFQSRMNFVDPDKPAFTNLEAYKMLKGWKCGVVILFSMTLLLFSAACLPWRLLAAL